MRVRRPGPPQSRKSVSDTAPLRRTRPRPCAWRQAGLSRIAKVLIRARDRRAFLSEGRFHEFRIHIFAALANLAIPEFEHEAVGVLVVAAILRRGLAAGLHDHHVVLGDGIGYVHPD